MDDSKIFAPMTVEGELIDLSRMVTALANAPVRFRAVDLIRAINGSYQFSQEVLNRLMQRWRRLGLCTFNKGRWSLTDGAWDRIQAVDRVKKEVANV